MWLVCLLQISTSFGNMDPFGTGQTLPPLQLPQSAAPSATITQMKKPPKWIRRPIAASFGVSLVSNPYLWDVAQSLFYPPFRHAFSAFFLFYSLVGNWFLWRIQSRTPSSLSSRVHMLYTSAKSWPKQTFWSDPTNCRPPWAQAPLWTSARERSVLLITSLRRHSGLFWR